MEETFAEYILSETDWVRKMEIAYYLEKKTKIFFDKTVVLKTEMAKLFIETMHLDVDENLVITACLLCNCKKKDSFTDLDEIHMYAKKGAEYLKTLGFSDRFCKICEEVNRYSGSSPREKESDILELVDQFGGMVSDRPERKGFSVEDALTLLEYRNLKGKDNRYLPQFKEFIKQMQEVYV